MSDSESEIELNEGIKQIDNQVIQNVLNYLKTGNFNNKTKQAYIIAYTIVYKLADNEQSYGSRLFDYYIKTISSYMEDEAFASLQRETNENFIEAFLKETEKCNILIHWMRKVFGYLDKFHTKNIKTGTLFANAVRSFNLYVYFPLKERIVENLNNMINDHRDGKTVDVSKIIRVIEVLEMIDLKSPVLQKNEDNFKWTGIHVNEQLIDWFKYFLISTEKYITNKFKKEITNLSAPEYVKSSLKYLSEEEERKNLFIKDFFHDKLDATNTKIIIDNHSRTLAKMDTGIQYMFDNKKENDLSEIFALFSRSLDSLKVIAEIMNPYIRERGDSLYLNKELARDPTKFIPELIKLKQEIDLLVEKSFSNNVLFQDCKNKAFSHFMNKEHYSKQLANYCDFEMKMGIRGCNESQIDEKLNNIINLFKCLNNKMIFQFEYSKKLTERLITGKTQSMHAEQILIAKLKAEQGVTFVNKMTSMLQDLEISRKLMDKYRLLSHRVSYYYIYF